MESGVQRWSWSGLAGTDGLAPADKQSDMTAVQATGRVFFRLFDFSFLRGVYVWCGLWFLVLYSRGDSAEQNSMDAAPIDVGKNSKKNHTKKKKGQVVE
ncbi:hypothetical protein L6452_22641 [Arctium lappa]|uniref:Uncharacterized protein n=1 Tax=Arctium lappa TaxID=4217 RepID=A0ACB9B0G4_ARCLA|nr:hypothetical protein L6452_22641 [Arctium lappa]